MNYKMVGKTLGQVLLVYAALMVLPLLVGLICREQVWNFLIAIAATALAGVLLHSLKTADRSIYADEGFVTVGLAWILMALFGAIPLAISGDLPSYVDAVFETASGLTTTGASVATNIEGMTRAGLFWRCFTHWIGGMGVLVFMLAVLPKGDEHSMHIMRAEVPGPVVGKLVPKMRDTAKILYAIYAVMTIVETALLCCGGLSFYDALLHSFSTAGTGGFSTYSSGVAAFQSAYVEIVIAVFMVLFGVNFNLYYLVLIRRFRAAVKSEELHVYLLVVLVSSLAIAAGITKMYGSFGTALRYAFFNVAAIISTTGFTHVDFTFWPQYCQLLLLLLMVLGGCAGSTGGGVKVSRVIILLKSAWADARQSVHTREVRISHVDGKTIGEKATRSVYSFFILYVLALLLSTLLFTLVGCDLTASFSGSLACLSNVGPGLSVFGPYGSYSFLPAGMKLYLALLMIFGRLEIYPVLMLMIPSVWKKQQRRSERVVKK